MNNLFDKDNIYYDLNFTNGTNNQIDIDFQQTRSDIILENPSDYYLTILRFNIPNNTPIFLWPNNNGVIDNTQYKVAIECQFTNIQSNQQNVDFFQQNYFDTLGNIGVYSYQSFLDMINGALYLSWNSLTNTGGLPAPFLSINYNTQLISLNVYAAIGNILKPSITDIRIFMNENLYLTYFNNFNVVNGSDFIPYDVEFIIDQTQYSTVINQTYFNYNFTSQEYINLSRWNEVTGLILRSNNLPVRKEFINNSTINNNSSTNDFRIQLTDFEPINSGSSTRDSFQFFTTGEYRLLDLLSKSPLQIIDIKAYWQDTLQNLYILNLNPGEFMSIKLLFRSKNFYRLRFIKQIDFSDNKNNENNNIKLLGGCNKCIYGSCLSCKKN